MLELPLNIPHIGTHTSLSAPPHSPTPPVSRWSVFLLMATGTCPDLQLSQSDRQPFENSSQHVPPAGPQHLTNCDGLPPPQSHINTLFSLQQGGGSYTRH